VLPKVNDYASFETPNVGFPEPAFEPPNVGFPEPAFGPLNVGFAKPNGKLPELEFDSLEAVSLSSFPLQQ